ncbi:MAG: hypothetical protein KA923_06120 [Opitutaceae bacterium]|nr:hypothetical protein [Opitutaceae bacterium]
MIAPKRKHLLPVDIELPDNVLLENGTMFVVLRTFDQIKSFWQNNKERFEFACTGYDSQGETDYLREGEWVFGNSKSSVVQTVMRWGKSGVRCEFYDWAADDPQEHAEFFSDRDRYRESRIKEGLWSIEDERDYIKRTPQTYRGWWRFVGRPRESEFSPINELIDPAMPIAEVERLLQEEVFDYWREASECDGLEALDRVGIEGVLSDWHSDQSAGQGT